MPPRFIIQDEGTIRETRDDTPPRPRKRQRTDSAIDTGGYSDIDCLTSVGPVEDDLEFYRSEAGANWLCPLVLIADADEFRALLWALYASPQERAAQPREHDDLDRLLLIAAISRQYRCATLETWAKAALLRTVTSNDAFIASCSPPSHHHAVALRIRAGDAPSVPAILVADTHELPRLRGVAYYAHIQSMLAAQQEGRGFATDPKLSNAQVMRLLSGHWSLVSLWERLRRTPPKFAIACASKKINAMSSASVLALLGVMRELLAADPELAKNIPAQCKLAALDAVKTQVKVLEDGLADHFFGWL
ncbi:hypothetical protein B0H13DRAFT_2108129 [Mycena leptocephala]|nr:hypothetical protein B0H13DRAFT_2108129 [Mycena leptocephala]